MKTLVLYYSRTGNTEAVARRIAEALGADIEPLRDDRDYGGVKGWILAGRDAFRGVRSALAPLAHAPAAYDLVILGQPVWAARPVPAVNALASSGQLRGRSLALFVTLDGGGQEACLRATAAEFEGADIVARTAFLRVGRRREENLRLAGEWAASLTSR